MLNAREAIVLALCFVARVYAQYCSEGHRCYHDEARGVVWVLREIGNIQGGTCQSVCEREMCGSGEFHQCVHQQAFDDVMTDIETLNREVLDHMDIECTRGRCWDGMSNDGQVWVGIDVDSTEEVNGRTLERRRCWLPEGNTFDCLNHPGNANCFGARFALVCPCQARELHEACDLWSSPPNSAATAVWPANEEGTSCLERVNYWRKRACDEGWPECPPCGLPPMVECVDCHECTNAEAVYNSINGPHSAGFQCHNGGAVAAGDGGGQTCANVIDAFVSERNDDGICEGHCGPIVRHGCATFSWGRQDPEDGNYHVLNWRQCQPDTCQDYCDNPTDFECFRHALSPSSSVSPTTDPPQAPTTSASPQTSPQAPTTSASPATSPQAPTTSDSATTSPQAPATSVSPGAGPAQAPSSASGSPAAGPTTQAPAPVNSPDAFDSGASSNRGNSVVVITSAIVAIAGAALSQ